MSCDGGKLTNCCRADLTYGCDGGKGCSCSRYDVPDAASQALTVAAEVRGDGCWNAHAADSAGNWGWCEHCSGGKLTVCCTPDKAINCVNGQNCQCSERNKPDGVSQALTLAAEVRATGCWNEHSADAAGN